MAGGNSVVFGRQEIRVVSGVSCVALVPDFTLLKVLISISSLYVPTTTLVGEWMDSYNNNMTDLVKAWRVIEDKMDLNVFVRDGWDTVRHKVIGGAKSKLVAQRIIYSYQENRLLENGYFTLHFAAQDRSKSSISVELKFRELSSMDKGKYTSVANLTRSPLYYMGPVLLSIVLYSFLPHKDEIHLSSVSYALFNHGYGCVEVGTSRLSFFVTHLI